MSRREHRSVPARRSGPVDEVLAIATRELRDAAAAGAGMPEADRLKALRRVLARQVHDALMRARTDGDFGIPGGLADLAATLRELAPDGVEDRLPTRVRVLIRLLRRGALEPAWMLAHDNASGRVHPSKAASTWAGGSFLTTALALPTATVGGRVFAWLPGFHDPRWNVPDDVYAMDSSVVLRHSLDGVRMHGDEVELFGFGYLSQLPTDPGDAVTVVFTGAGGAEHRVRAHRERRPDLVAARGPELTRLAWGGWRAAVPLAPVAAVPGTWRAALEIEVGEVHRSHPLGTTRGPLGHLLPGDGTAAGDASGDAAAPLRWGSESNGRLRVRVG